MSIRELKPKIEYPRPQSPLIQCQFEVNYYGNGSEQWRIKRNEKMGRQSFDQKKCMRHSTIEIDGKQYCRPHAAQIALTRWLRGELK